jgi:hypothetical protein
MTREYLLILLVQYITPIILKMFGYCTQEDEKSKSKKNLKNEIIEVENVQFDNINIPEEIPEFLIDCVNFLEKYGIFTFNLK